METHDGTKKNQNQNLANASLDLRPVFNPIMSFQASFCRVSRAPILVPIISVSYFVSVSSDQLPRRSCLLKHHIWRFIMLQKRTGRALKDDMTDWHPLASNVFHVANLLESSKIPQEP